RRSIPKLTAPVSAILAVAGVEHDWRANTRQTKSMGCCLAATMYPLAH
ncbi:inovirus Gp2 family protein, partial [Escherichia coli]|nr:inovirus Gp2 family protein [Escherichia coli]